MTSKIDDKTKPKHPRRKRTPPPGATYEVGYARPPMHGRFQEGQSGNPRGRPRQSRNLITLIKDELESTVTVSVGGKPKTMTKRQVIATRMVHKAMDGDQRATDRLVNISEKHGLLEPEPGTSGVVILPASVGPEEYHRLYGKAAQGAPVPQEIKDALKKMTKRHRGS